MKRIAVIAVNLSEYLLCTWKVEEVCGCTLGGMQVMSWHQKTEQKAVA